MRPDLLLAIQKLHLFAATGFVSPCGPDLPPPRARRTARKGDAANVWHVPDTDFLGVLLTLVSAFDGFF